MEQPSWPRHLWPVFARSVTVQYASLTRGGAPVMVPVTPFAEDGTGSLDVSTGLAFPVKAERARRNPKVCLLYADPVGSGLADPPVVLVQGLASVRDANLQANTDRYVRSVRAKTPDAFRGLPAFVLRRLDWYFARIWIQVTPVRMWWWSGRSLDAAPGEWADGTATAPPSDPTFPGNALPGKPLPRTPPPAWPAEPAGWRPAARAATARLGQPDLSWAGPDGFPLAVPVWAEQTGPGFRLRFGRCLPGVPQGPACLTFHWHPPRFTGQENRSFAGDVCASGRDGVFRVDRLLPDVSLTGNRLTAALGFLGQGRRLAPRLRAEAARRGQPVPRVRPGRPLPAGAESFPDD